MSENLQCIEGFEDCGSQGRSCNIANHALLFRSQHRKWKRPVAYHFTRGSTKAEMIVQYLKEVLDAYQNAGLTVVGTFGPKGRGRQAIERGNHYTKYFSLE
jgi:hypothetical protein